MRREKVRKESRKEGGEAKRGREGKLKGHAIFKAHDHQ